MSGRVVGTPGELDEVAGRSGLRGVALVSARDRLWHQGDVDAEFAIYSVTKSVVAAALLRVANEEDLDLDTSAGVLLEDDRLDVSVRDLLTHTSGIPDYGRLPEYHQAVYETPSRPWSDEIFLERALASEPDFAPGAGWTYSNTGYLLLRLILDRRGGLASFLPALGFSSAHVAEGLADFDAAVPAQSSKIGYGSHQVAGRYHPAWVGHRTLIASARELHRFWSQPRPAFLDRKHFRYIGFDYPGYVRPSYGLGVEGDLGSPLGLTIGHGGEGPGYCAAALAAPEHEAVCIVLEPTEAFPAKQLAADLLNAAIGSLNVRRPR